MRVTEETFFCPCGIQLEYPSRERRPEILNSNRNLSSSESESNSELETKEEHDSQTTDLTRFPTAPIQTSNETQHRRQPEFDSLLEEDNETSEIFSAYGAVHLNETTNNVSQNNLRRSQTSNVRTASSNSSETDLNNGNIDEINKCSRCQQKFNIFAKRKKTCRSCNENVCSSCSKGKWPAAMLPKDCNPRNEKSLRICISCHERLECFRAALLNGKKSLAEEIMNSGVVQLYFPFLIYPKKHYPIHCAAVSGSLETVQWLISKRCNPRVLDADNNSALTVAAKHGYFDICKFLVFRGYSQVTEIKEVGTLQKILRTCFIQIQKHEIQTSIFKYSSTQTSTQTVAPKVQNQNELCSPKNEVEEIAQLELALRMSEIDQHQNTVEGSSNKIENNNESECVVCFEEVVNCVLIPCGHMSCCNVCGTKLKECPVCRQAISQIVRTYKT